MMYVYVLGSTQNKTKIGITTDPTSRFKQIRTTSKLDLHLEFICTVDKKSGRPGTLKLEAEALRRLANFRADQARMRSEWFYISAREAAECVRQTATDMGIVLNEIPGAGIRDGFRNLAAEGADRRIKELRAQGWDDCHTREDAMRIGIEILAGKKPEDREINAALDRLVTGEQPFVRRSDLIRAILRQYLKDNQL